MIPTETAFSVKERLHWQMAHHETRLPTLQMEEGKKAKAVDAIKVAGNDKGKEGLGMKSAMGRRQI